jgi:hypothetical protein
MLVLLQLFRRAECLNAAFQNHIADVIGHMVTSAAMRSPESAATEASLTPDESGQEQAKEAQNLSKQSVAPASGQMDSFKASESDKMSARPHKRQLNMLSSNRRSSLSRLSISSSMASTADFLFAQSPHKLRLAHISSSFKNTFKNSAAGPPVALPSSTFLVSFLHGVAEIEFHPAPIKSTARMREKLGEYADAGVAWPRCAAILDPVSSYAYIQVLHAHTRNRYTTNSRTQP